MPYMLFYKQHFYFISNAKLKLEKHQANAKQHTETELLLFENYSHSSSSLSSKNNIIYSEKSKIASVSVSRGLYYYCNHIWK